jgi:hypothetical protein
MIGKLLAAFVGSRIDRRDGHGGVKGAVLGYATQRLVTRMGPFGWFILGVVALWRLLFGRRKRSRSRY